MYTSVVCVICQILLYQFLKVCLRTFFKLIRQKSKIVPVTTGIVVMVVFDVIAALVCVCYSQQHCYNNHHCQRNLWFDVNSWHRIKYLWSSCPRSWWYCRN